ncbi:cobalt transporter subunit (CbtB) [Calothrix sp. HK-06]|nr:cobalt transporter subunit (CbtB) [Calothrix sp. HK-06]
MTAYSSGSKVWKKTTSIALSKPMQVSLYMMLSTLTIWTVLFSTYPAAHNQAHALRHNTASVACH